MPRLSLRGNLGIALIATTLVSTGALSWVGYRRARDIIRRNAVELLAGIADERRTVLVETLRLRHRRLEDFLREEIPSCAEDAACVRGHLARLLQREEAAGGLVVLPSGARVAIHPTRDPFAATLTSRFGAPDFGSRPEVTAVVGAIGGRISFDPTVFDSVVGRGGRLGETGQSFITAEDGRLVVWSDRLDPIAETRASPRSEPLKRCLAGQSGEALAPNAAGIPMIHAFRPLLPGCLMVQISPAEAFAPATALMRGALIFTPLLIGAAVLLALVLSRWLTRPIEALIASTRAVRAGSFDCHIEGTRGPAELQELCETFNGMVAKLHESALFRERFIGILGHDLRNPLSAIRLSAHALAQRAREQAKPGDMLASSLDLISRAAERMNRMVVQLLDFARARGGGGIPLRCTTVDLADVTRTVVAELETAHPDRAILFRVAGDATGFWDADRLAQVASNLIGNAVEHGASPADAVTVELQGGPGEVGLRVHNDGAPIDPAVLPKIFDAYQRGDKSRRGGLGLGLFVVSEIVKAHEGQVHVTSSADEGTTFVVRLPRHRKGATSVEGSHQVALEPGRRPPGDGGGASDGATPL